MAEQTAPSKFFIVPSALKLVARVPFFHLYVSEQAPESLCGADPDGETPVHVWDKYATTKGLLQVCPYCAKVAASLTSSVAIHKCEVCGTLDSSRDIQMCRDDKTGRTARMCRMCREDHLAHGRQYDLI